MDGTENTATVGQTETPHAIEFDDSGELQFTDAGWDSFKDLLNGAPEAGATPPPTEQAGEEIPEDEEDEEQAPEETPPATTPTTQPTRKLKVNGQEIEKTEDEVVALAQMGMDYQQKMAEWREKDSALAPFEALIQQLRSDPGLSQHLAAYYRQPQAQPEKPQFDDPIDQLKWEIKQEILGEARNLVEKTVTPLQQKVTEADIKATLARDADYPVVMQILGQQVMQTEQTLGRAAAATLFQRLDKDPATFMEAYKQAKNLLAEVKKTPQPKPSTEKTPPATTQETPPAVKRTERAPVLESAGTAPPPEAAAKQKAKVDRLKANALRSGNTEVLADFLDAGGFLDHLK